MSARIAPCITNEMALEAGLRLIAIGSATAMGWEASFSGGNFSGNIASRRFVKSPIQSDTSGKVPPRGTTVERKLNLECFLEGNASQRLDWDDDQMEASASCSDPPELRVDGSYDVSSGFVNMPIIIRRVIRFPDISLNKELFAGFDHRYVRIPVGFTRTIIADHQIPLSLPAIF